MTLTDVAHKVVEGWMIDKRISIPAIISIIVAATTAAFFLSDLKNDSKANSKELESQKQEINDLKAFTKAIPLISERVGRLEATVAASSFRQEQAFDEIKALIVQTRPKNSAPIVRRP